MPAEPPPHRRRPRATAIRRQGGGRLPAAADDPLARFRAGEAEAFDDLVAEFEPRLVQYFYRLCWDRDRAEDLTQTLFMKLLRSARRYRPEGRLATYVFRIATNLWIDQYRQAGGGRRPYSLDQAIDGGYEPAADPARRSPVEEAQAKEEKARLRDALERLTEPHRLVFELAVYQELPYAEVGAILGIPVGTVKSRMHNTVRALKEMLGAGDREDATGDPFRGGRTA